MSTIRDVRLNLGLSQARLASLLTVSQETYRTWDSGRRPTPARILVAARALSTPARHNRPLPLYALAKELGIHERTLRKAARDGRLKVIYDTRVCFGKLMRRATRAAGDAFMRTYYKQTTRGSRRPRPPVLPTVPADYHARVIGLRRRLGLTQAQLAETLGAANKAVVYQWETRRRTPSPLFWKRVDTLERRLTRQAAVLGGAIPTRRNRQTDTVTH